MEGWLLFGVIVIGVIGIIGTLAYMYTEYGIGVGPKEYLFSIIFGPINGAIGTCLLGVGLSVAVLIMGFPLVLLYKLANYLIGVF